MILFFELSRAVINNQWGNLTPPPLLDYLVRQSCSPTPSIFDARANTMSLSQYVLCTTKSKPLGPQYTLNLCLTEVNQFKIETSLLSLQKIIHLLLSADNNFEETEINHRY